MAGTASEWTTMGSNTNSTINTVKDVIASGEDVSGVVFTRDYYTSSYSNGDLERK